MTSRSHSEDGGGQIAADLLHWWDDGHADLPWRGLREPYPIWISEVMAQQTQLATVIPYFERWMDRFPSVAALAAAPLDDVLKLWEGLGYYSRARNLHAAAREVVERLDGELPRSAAGLQQLPGIGRYTAGSIASICYDEPAAAVDGNVTRVLTRLFDLDGDISRTAVKNELWRLAEALVPDRRPGDYNQALMELGQAICTPRTPACAACPLAAHCLARRRGTQHERPVRPARPTIPHVDVVAGVIWREAVGREPLLITRRPLDGMLGGLWEFPGGKQENGESPAEALAREIREEMGIQIDVPGGRPFVAVKHTYTHFRITLHALHAIYRAGEIQHIGVYDHAWVTLADLSRYAFAATDKKIIEALRRAADPDGRPLKSKPA